MVFSFIMLKAITMLVCLSVVLLIFAGCNDSSEATTGLQEEIDRYRTEGDKLSGSTMELENLNRESESLIRNVEREQNREAQIRLEFEEIDEYANDLRAADTYIDGRLAAWRTAASQYLIGSEIGDVRLNSGNILRSAVVVVLTAESVTVRHSDGEQTFGYEEFPEAVRLKLFHEPTIILTTKLSKP